MKIGLIIDSCCDLTEEMSARINPQVAYLHVKVEETNYVDDGTVNIKRLIEHLAFSKKGGTSACPSVEDFASKMRTQEASIVVTLSAKLSGSYNAARLARELVLEQYPGKKIHVVDSKSASAGETLLALHIQDCIEAGMDFDDITASADARAAATQTIFVLEDMGNLIKNGRLSRIPGMLASILSICPIMADDGNGEIRLLAKVRGIQNSLKRLCEIVAERTAEAKEAVTLVLAHCNCPERAESLKRQLTALCPAIKQIWTVQTGALSSLYANDGGIVLAF